MNAIIIKVSKNYKELGIKNYRIIIKQVPPLINQPVSSSVKRKSLKALKKF